MGNSEPLISVIVPVYKVEKYLDRCVLSIVNQTYKNLEIILVDDGSPDACPAMCDRWAEKDSRIKVVHKENGGVSDARNVGMSVARGEYIGFVDSDDYVSFDMYESLLCNLEENGSDISCCGIKMVWDDGKESIMTSDGEFVFDNLQALKSLITEDRLKQVVWNRLYKRETVAGVLFPTGKRHEDVFWNYKAISRANKVSGFEKVCYCYFQNDSGFMGGKYSSDRLYAIEAYEEIDDFVDKYYPSLSAIVKAKLLGCCLYNSQLLLKSEIQNKGQLFKRIRETAKRTGKNWRKCDSISIKQKLWYEMYLLFPKTTCYVRNMLKVGL